MISKEKIIEFKNGVKIVNVTPHPIRFQDGDELVEVEPSGVVINARIEERVVKEGVPMLVTSTFKPDKDSEEALSKIEKEFPGVLVVGSVIAAQAFPGRVVGMVPVEGFERVPPEEKRMRSDKFTIFER